MLFVNYTSIKTGREKIIDYLLWANTKRSEQIILEHNVIVAQETLGRTNM